jgi:hypothetical protein
MTEEPRQSLTPPPPPPKVGPLTTISRVRAELARVYRDARQGTIETSDATRLAFILVSLGRLIEQSDLEARMNAVERALEEDANQPSHPVTTH